MNKNLIIAICLIINFLGVSYLGYLAYNCKSCRTISMYPGCLNYTASAERPDFNAVGLYMRGADYYCVWTKGEYFQSEIDNTETHEACHHLVYEDTEHFCSQYKDKICNERIK